MIADVICYWKLTSFTALDCVTSFLRLKDVTNTCNDERIISDALEKQNWNGKKHKESNFSN